MDYQFPLGRKCVQSARPRDGSTSAKMSPQKMQHEGHIREFMQTGIDIAGDAGHATLGGEASSTDPVNDHLVTNAAHDLPSQDTRRCRQASAPSQWMSGQKCAFILKSLTAFFTSLPNVRERELLSSDEALGLGHIEIILRPLSLVGSRTRNPHPATSLSSASSP